jgi:hypothetical protein
VWVPSESPTVTFTCRSPPLAFASGTST